MPYRRMKKRHQKKYKKAGINKKQLDKKSIQKKKRMLISYTLQALVIFLLGLMLILMVCGCLYIYEHVFKKGEHVQGEDAYYGASAHLGVEGKDDYQYTVVIDAGHGGKDGGTEKGAAIEKDINLAVALFMKSWLEGEGIGVILTRDSDVYIDLDERVEIANEEHADLFVSIHCNYYEKDSSIKGLECYYDENSEKAKDLAEKFVLEIAERETVTSRGTKPGNYHILRNAQIPAILVEMGYLSNYEERTNLQSQDYQKMLAIDLAKGVYHLLEKDGTNA